ncbi:probable serine/threonine-protein kinase PBL28 isoform X1 [Cryptomeria japonica]|uniref:probable serine/threonine-protein kinase PBL28 isoform X1 n=1 Tax=Cryptomeria japonica TaxID=3369 RepID=UPI0027DA4B79|nr:probable serine/threonine-protein kinase PBL28 isoform X1 [Cryptomeria japonica]
MSTYCVKAMKIMFKKSRWRRRSWRLTLMGFLRGRKRAVKKFEGCKPGDIEKAEDMCSVNSSLRFSLGGSELDWELFSGETCVLPALEGLIIFKYCELNAATCNFSQDRVLGRGAHSCVYRGRLGFGKLIAVKSLDMNNKEACKIFCRELHISSNLKNRHVVPLLGFCIDSRGLFLVYKFISGGDLQYHLYDKKENSLSWSARLRVAIGIAKAVHYMHHGSKTCVVHRDIKPSNVLLSSRKTAKLCDFGLATQTLGPLVPFFCKTVSGTFGYLAPEYFEYGKVSEKTDIYAFGVVLLELLTGQKITSSARSFLNVEMPKEKLIDPQLKSCDKAKKKKKHKEVERLMRAAAVCLHPMESRRLCMSQILRILKGQEDSKLLQHAQLAMLNFDAEYIRRKEKETLMDHLRLAVVGMNLDGDSKMPDNGDDK